VANRLEWTNRTKTTEFNRDFIQRTLTTTLALANPALKES